MSTTSYKRTYNLPFTFDDVLKLIKSFSIEDKVRLEKRIGKRKHSFTGHENCQKKIKVNDLSTEDIVAEVAEYRKKRNADQKYV